MGRTLLKRIGVWIAIAVWVGGWGQPSAAQSVRNSAGNSERRDWPIYGGTAENSRYSPLAQINRENVKQLQVAWAFDTGETGGLQTSPIIVGGVLFAYTSLAKSDCPRRRHGQALVEV